MLGVRCPGCGEEVYSDQVFEYSTCKCETVYVKGANVYLGYYVKGPYTLTDVRSVRRPDDEEDPIFESDYVLDESDIDISPEEINEELGELVLQELEEEASSISITEEEDTEIIE